LGDSGGERRLVLVQLSGGNDGLSTVVPYADDVYGRARSTTRLERSDVLPLDDYRGLHGACKNLANEWNEGRLAIVEGMGYPDMIRSHFRALEVWHTADRRGRDSGDGWLGRLAETGWAEGESSELVVHLGPEAPYSVYSTERPPIALVSPTAYQWFGDRPEAQAYGMAGEDLERDKRAAESQHRGRDAALARMRGVLDDARDSSLRIRRAAAEYRPHADYPREPFAAGLHDVAALIQGRLDTRIFSVSLGGFDTHATQRGAHDALMRTLDEALGAFLEDLSHSEEGRNTTVAVFSEFGRRLEENASRGTDHGKAGPMLIMGPAVRGGLLGEHPDLTQLDGGDPTWTTDFRSVYGTLIEGWFGIEHERVLGARYPLLPLFR
jgi:uncharacterized protein (DUF1501 family)